ncbi:hypothetical protein [Pedobacter sp. SYSU D00535]|uniref:hypothetical protein n=1 Tax=Pedobacter sp. SYSU D00535 TaxID=2810308 RepID=UPI001A969862|nr:hypothetical protein [Pedobacter sp. SYSU D00535]
MKTKRILIVLLMVFSFFDSSAQSNSTAITGAWQTKEADKEHVLILQDGFFFHTAYNKENKRFVFSQGGRYTQNAEDLTAEIYFSTVNREEVGKKFNASASITGTTLRLFVNGQTLTWTRLDDGSAPLAGTWRITSRMQDGKLSPIHQTGARQTYKILSGTRFQWAAINPETKEFSGTGGGTYTFRNGKYTENIEFFSRDSSRVGASLTFDGKLENGEWHHSGLSSKGAKIYEVWSRVK